MDPEVSGAETIKPGFWKLGSKKFDKERTSVKYNCHFAYFATEFH